jgi:peptide-methionine (S)-S-oxide reductase
MQPPAKHASGILLAILVLLCGAYLMAFTNFFGGKPARAAEKLPAPAMDLPADLNAKPGETHDAIVAGGCFWCIDGVFRQLDGVTAVVSGYAGGAKSTANYETVCSGTTGHAESVKITYDPAKITYGRLLQVLFTVIDPTTKDRQGPDAGTQYRSAVFYENDEQKMVAAAYIQQLDATHLFPAPIVTTLEPLKPDAFYPAEDYHQNYVACHLHNSYIQYEALPKIDKLRSAFPNSLKAASTQPANAASE